MLLKKLECGGPNPIDVAPLTGMPLTDLALWGKLAGDLAPLRDMPLKTLRLPFEPAEHTVLLRSIKTLETINFKPVAEFWKEVEEAEGERKQP